jgi:hypothetical protein
VVSRRRGFSDADENAELHTSDFLVNAALLSLLFVGSWGIWRITFGLSRILLVCRVRRT